MDLHIKEQIEMMNQQAKELSSLYHGAASSSGISDNEFWIWYVLILMEGEYSQQDICDVWSLPKQTVNSVISNMSKKGLVFLEAVPGTRNRKIIRLTDEGKKYGEDIVMPIYQAEVRALEKISVKEREAYIKALGKFIDFLKTELNQE